MAEQQLVLQENSEDGGHVEIAPGPGLEIEQGAGWASSWLTSATQDDFDSIQTAFRLEIGVVSAGFVPCSANRDLGRSGKMLHWATWWVERGLCHLVTTRRLGYVAYEVAFILQ